MTDLAALLDAPDPDEMPTDEAPRKKLNFLAPTTGKTDFALVPVGTYQGTIVGNPQWTYSSNGNLRLAFPVQFEVDGGTRQLWADFYHTENSMWRVADFLWTAGWTPEELYADLDLENTDDLGTYQDLIAARLPDQSVTLTVIHDTWNNETKAKIKTIKAHKQTGKRPGPPKVEEAPAEDVEIGF